MSPKRPCHTECGSPEHSHHPDQRVITLPCHLMYPISIYQPPSTSMSLSLLSQPVMSCPSVPPHVLWLYLRLSRHMPGARLADRMVRCTCPPCNHATPPPRLDTIPRSYCLCTP